MKGGALAVLLGLGACATRPGLGGAVQQGQVQRVETYLNGLHGVRAHFVQTWPDGGTGGGTMAYDPGHMRLDYVSPHGMQMVAGEGHLTLHDDQNGSLTRVALSRNPLGMLLRVPLHLSGDIRVTAVQAQPGSLQLTLVRTDAPTEGALTLTFSDSAGQLALVGLQGVDARQHRIVLHLTDVTEGATLPASLFTPPSG
ncbi:outer membrane lipoprotein carrier protein LolA [Ameyamaea chiangmaiensis]|uniref:Outer membrane lipoprotein carrier protein LolA n=1 Tax=Ameyamaea chiangmaiensis TaxID=442969 RepID=A0A850P7S4_9PROT|nr:outer membrane lipoprotein carrier protein LolA [Ameyamaea chiangmaiensis]MBS4073750.1 outer membrane lipoprotein carrier protein LolA [Ameyamaea chiangmaiensis]NVN39984.1 outer membrane lipoprotein carrier protein LolA [Ameyamaea chiangmaiensis]